MKIFVTIFFTVAASLPSFSQDYSYKQFTTDDGLSSNVVYSVFQDREGYIWFCTNAGVSRFNGTYFKNYTVKEGLSDNEVFQAVQTRSGKILFITFNGKTCYYQNGIIHNEKTDPWLKQNFPALGILHEDKYGNFWTMNADEKTLFVWNEQLKLITSLPSVRHDSLIVVSDKRMDTLSVLDNSVIEREVHRFMKENEKVINSFPDIRAYVSFIKSYIRKLNKLHPSVSEDYLNDLFFRFNIPKFRFLEFSYPEKDECTWLSHGNMGIISCRNLFDLTEKPTVYLPRKNVSFVFIDAEGNYWFTSNSEGVFLLNTSVIKNYQGEIDTPEIYSITGGNNSIVAGKNNEVWFLNKSDGKTSTVKLNAISASSLYNRVKDVLIDGDSLWVASDIGGFVFHFLHNKPFTQNSLVRKSMFSSSPLKCVTRAENGIFVGTHISFLSSDPTNNKGKYFTKRVTAITEISSNELLLGSIDGLYSLTGGKVSPFKPEAEIFRHSVTDIVAAKDNSLCVATSEIGLIVLKEDEYFVINSTNSLPAEKRLASDICREVFVDASQNIWVCTNLGLDKLKIDSWSPFSFTVQHFTTDDGLLSNDVNDVYLSHDTVWVATMGGLSMFRSDLIKRQGNLPLIYISNYDSIHDRKFPSEIKISIFLEGISYESLTKIRYQYKLVGLNDTWQTTERHEIYYEALAPGDYVFQVYSINRYGQRSARPAIVSFTILPKWWQTIWAYILYIVSFILFLVSALYLVRRNFKIKERARMLHRDQLQQLELNALRAQMNPHFIFNTLNAIQKYILENNSDLSYRYLSKFSKLIRNFLDTSRQTSVILQQELDLLESYLEIEALRFRNKFTYAIELGSNLDPSVIKIPSMLLQPYVENAIWHGIQHKNGNGYVKISIHRKDSNVLKCWIEDNGIGRNKAKEIEGKSIFRHQPVGMTITQQRLELINQRLKDAVSVRYIDLVEPFMDGSSGTIVELMIAYSSKKNE